MGRDDLLGEFEFVKGFAHHHERCQFRQGASDGLGDERHRARRPGIHLDDIDLTALDGILNIHQPHHPQAESQVMGGAHDFIHHRLGQGIRGHRARTVPGMDARLLDVLHDAADHHLLAIADCVDVHLDGVTEKTVHQDRMLRGSPYRELHILAQRLDIPDDLHRPSAQHVGGPHQNRVTHFLGDRLGFGCAASHRALWALQLQGLQEFIEALAILRPVDGIRRGPDDWGTGAL